MNAQFHPLSLALDTVFADASDVLHVPVKHVVVERVEAAEWPDRCLGLPEDGEMCARAITPGYLIRLGHGLTYRTDLTGKARRERQPYQPTDTEVRLRYTVSGGIGGWSSTFETDSSQLSDVEEAELLQLIEDADFFNVETPEPTTVVFDGITSRLWIARSRRDHEVVRGDGIEAEDTDAFTALMRWAAERTPPLFPRSSTVLD